MVYICFKIIGLIFTHTVPIAPKLKAEGSLLSKFGGVSIAAGITYRKDCKINKLDLIQNKCHSDSCTIEALSKVTTFYVSNQLKQSSTQPLFLPLFHCRFP